MIPTPSAAPTTPPALDAVNGESTVAPLGGRALRRGKFWLRLVIAVVILSALAVAGRRYYDELGRLRSASPWLVAAMAGLYVLGRLPTAELMRASLRSLGHRVGRMETFFILMVQYYVNMLIPRAGIGVPAGYYKLRHGIPVADFGAAQLLPVTLVQFGVLGVLALLCQVGLALTGRAKFDPVLAAVFAGVALASTVPLLANSRIPGLAGEAGGLIGKFLNRLSDAVGRLGRDRTLVARACAAHAVVLLLRAARIQVSFYAVGQPVGFWQAFVASAAADVMFLVSVTPGALGFREGAMVYAARVLGTTGDVALAAAVLDRIVISGCNLVLGQIGLWRYVGRGAAPRESGPPEAGLSDTPR